MPVNRNLWRRRFSSFPSWDCPRCKQATLRLLKDSAQKSEAGWSKAARGHEAWEPEWKEERFICFLACQNSECEEVVAICGDVFLEEDHNSDLQQHQWSERYVPWAVHPPLPIFRIPDDCPTEVAEELEKAFAFYWKDPAASANRLRVAVETMLTEQRIARTTVNKKRKRVSLDLHSRIDRFKKVKPESADYLLAIKWLGNIGSHGSIEGLDDESLLNGFEFFEQAIEHVYVGRDARLRKTAKGISARKGKPKKK